MPRSYVTVVSGMPRSGTSLMMRMVDRGGISALTDGQRVPDEHNPHGYFEDNRTRRLAEDASWMAEARGKALKVIYRLLPHLPHEFEYRVIFMERDLNQIYRSQQDMLLSSNDPAAGQDRDRIVRAMAADLESARAWLAKQDNICQLGVPYAGLVSEPVTWVGSINGFLDGGLDQSAMVAVIDPALYRHR